MYHGVLLCGVLLLLIPEMAIAEPIDAVVRIPSHGCAGTVVATGPGESWIITCAHAFEGRDRDRPLKIDAPCPRPGQQQQEGTGVRVMKVDHNADLCLIRLPVGPLPFFAPVGTVQPRPGTALQAVGHARMAWPANVATVHVVDLEGPWTHTREHPTPGDSGGPLIDGGGNLVGTCTGYEAGGGRRGMYVNLATIRRFMGLDGAPAGGPGPRSPAPSPRQLGFG